MMGQVQTAVALEFVEGDFTRSGTCSCTDVGRDSEYSDSDPREARGVDFATYGGTDSSG